MNLDLSLEEQNQIIYEFEKTKISMSKIAKAHRLSVEQLYSFIESYYKQIEREPVRTKIKGVKKAKRTKEDNYLIKLEKIEKFCEENNRVPRSIIPGVLPAKKVEQSTLLQKELALGRSLDYISYKLEIKYPYLDIESIDNELDKNIIEKMLKIATYTEVWEQMEELNNIENWCVENR